MISAQRSAEPSASGTHLAMLDTMSRRWSACKLASRSSLGDSSRASSAGFQSASSISAAGRASMYGSFSPRAFAPPRLAAKNSLSVSPHAGCRSVKREVRNSRAHHGVPKEMCGWRSGRTALLCKYEATLRHSCKLGAGAHIFRHVKTPAPIQRFYGHVSTDEAALGLDPTTEAQLDRRGGHLEHCDYQHSTGARWSHSLREGPAKQHHIASKVPSRTIKPLLASARGCAAGRAAIPQAVAVRPLCGSAARAPCGGGAGVPELRS